jgi:hypothetical protein
MTICEPAVRIAFRTQLSAIRRVLQHALPICGFSTVGKTQRTLFKSGRKLFFNVEARSHGAVRGA